MAGSLNHMTTNRRTLIAGATAAVAGAAGVALIASHVLGGEGETPTATNVAAQLTSEPGSPVPATTSTAPTDTTTALRASNSAFQIDPGMALVTSPRLPLFGVGSAHAQGLIDGSIASWLDAGSPIELAVEVLAIEGQAVVGSTPVDTFANYDDLATALWSRPGGIALIPLDEVDFRVNVLAVDGIDPLRDVPSEADPLIRIGVVGDIVPGRNVANKMIEYNDFTHPFHRVAAELNSYDITFANLEGNLSATLEAPDDAHTFTFVADPAMTDGLKLAGIDAVSLANNHSRWNSEGWGDSAFIDTMDALNAAGVAFFGGGLDLSQARAPWVATVGGRSVAILGIDGVTANEEPRENFATVDQSWFGASEYAGAGDGVAGTNPYFLDQVLSDISDAAGQYDIVIPYFHFGVEYVGVLPQWAVDGARSAIDAGASAVVTNHPHVIQGMEIYDGKPIVYSVGNFIFDQMFSVETRQGLILELDFRGNRVVGLRCRGVEIVDFNQPRLMTSGEHASLMDRFWWSTDRLAER